MKSISITFRAPSVTIPLNYQYGVQGLIYNALRGADEAGEQWHESSVDYGLRRYKLFTFSSLRGNKKIADGKITFDNLVYLDVRGVRDDFCDALISALNRSDDLTLLGHAISVQSVKWSSPKIETDTINIKMLSPLTIHRTKGEKTTYYTPLDMGFPEQINQNFRRKYAAFDGHEPRGGIQLTPLRIGTKDKYVTTFKGVHITAWRGEYTLLGKPEYLNFLYYCGLGARNSDGFGMFEPT